MRAESSGELCPLVVAPEAICSVEAQTGTVELQVDRGAAVCERVPVREDETRGASNHGGGCRIGVSVYRCKCGETILVFESRKPGERDRAREVRPDFGAPDLELEPHAHDGADEQVVAHAPPLELDPVEGGSGRLDLLVEDVGGTLQ